MTLKMVDTDERFPKADSKAFRGGVPHEKRCQQTRSAGSSDAIEIRDCSASPFQSGPDQRLDFDQVVPGGNFRDNSAKFLMKRYLAGNLRRQQLVSSVEYRNRRLVARSLNREC